MAFYDNQEDEDQQNANAQAPGAQTQSGSSVITGNGSGSVSAQGSAPQAKTNSPDRPGNFVNLQDYLNANKSQSEKLGDQTSGVINQSAGAAREGVSSFNQEAADKIKPVNSLSSDVSDKIKNSAETLSPEERAQAKATASATYQGPQSYTDLNSYQSAADATQKASQNIDNTGTEQGRMSLISQINSKPRTQGMNVFDNALLQSGAGRDKISQTAAANQDVRGGLDSAAQAVQGQIGRADDPSTPDIDESAGAIGQTNKAQADAHKQIQDSLAAWQAGFAPKVASAQSGLVDKENSLTQDIGNDPYNLSDESLSALGLSRGSRLYGLNLNDYLSNPSPSDINSANIATPEDYARYGALADLAGDQSNILDQANIAQAGTAPSAIANQPKLQAALADAQQNYTNSYKNETSGILGTGFNIGGKDPSNWPSFTTAQGHTPDWIENTYIPQLEQSSDPGDQTSAEALKQSLDQWKKNQGYNNVVDPYGGPGADPTIPTMGPGHLIHR